MAIERVDYNSDDEYAYALQMEEDYFRMQKAEEEHLKHQEFLDYSAAPYIKELKELDPEILKFILESFCPNCLRLKSECICKKIESGNGELPF